MMHLSRGLLAVLFAVGASFAAAGCVSDGTGQVSGAGGGGTVDLLANCGNGRVETDLGEQCERGTPGCAFNCRYTCDPDVPDVCNDGNVCNGDETCDATTHTCTPGTPPLDGTQPCGDINVCKGGACVLREANCGDHYTVPPEECDDGNKVDGDGCDSCKFSCVSSDPTRDCTGDLCAKPRTCNNLTHTCSPRDPRSDGYQCMGTTVGTAGYAQCLSGVCVPCGNGVVDAGEECDDGNSTSGDGCDNDCKYSCDPTDPARNCSSTNPCLGKVTCNTTTHTCPAEFNKPNGTYCSTSTVASGNCIAGACVPPTCGDHVVALTLETCDDGNLDPKDGCTPDCSYTCTTSSATADCTTGYPTTNDPPLLNVPKCNMAVCTNNKCAYASDPSKNNISCNTSGGSGTCDTTGTYGACTASKCGNGTLDAGEECDLGTANNILGSGCDPGCVYSCHANSDCDDGDPCNGTETCQTSGALGVPQSCIIPNQKQPDGTACGTGRICLNGGCAVSTCGDFYVNPATEQCDPPNTTGCDATCKAIQTCTGYDDAWWSDQNIIPVSWGGNLIARGSGNIVQITLAHAVRTPGSTPPTFSLDLRPCALNIPDFYITSDTVRYPLLGGFAGEKYGTDFVDVFPNATRTFQSSLTLASLSPGARVDINQVSLLMGLTMDNPYGAWPASYTDLIDGNPSPYEEEDYDNDGKFGMTVTSKTITQPTAGYKDPVVAILTTDPVVTVGRADHLYISTRAAVTQVGTLNDCQTITGNADILYIDTHIVGCHRAEAGVGECAPSDVALVDGSAPQYTVVGTSTFTAKHMAAAPNPANPCADAIALYP